MFQTFIRGRHYFTRKKRKLKGKRSIISRPAELRTQIRRLIRKSYNPRRYRAKQKIRKLRRYLSNSYFRRYFFPKHKGFRRRTLRLNPNLPFDYQTEHTIFYKLHQDLRRQDINKMLNTKKVFLSSYKPLSERAFYFGRVYLTFRRRNTFITVSSKPDNYLNTPERVIFKTSSGLLGLGGPKRRTFHARLDAIKDASSYLAAQELTSVDIIFSSRIVRGFNRFIKAIIGNFIYVRYLVISKRKPHGSVRKKKEKRL